MGATGSGISQSGLVAEFRFLDGAGQVLTDNVNGYDGQLGTTSGSDTGDPTWEASPAALYFDGNDEVRITDAMAATGTGAITAFVTASLADGVIWPYLLSGEGDVGAEMLFLGGERRFYPAIIGVEGNVLFYSDLISPVDTPRVYVMRFTPGEGLAGWETPSGVATKTVNVSNGTVMTRQSTSIYRLGALPGNGVYHTGRIYHVALYNTALSDGAVEANIAAIASYMSARGVTIG